MNRRQYIVPAISVLGLSLTTACADPMIGEWEASQMSSDGQTTTLPYSYTYSNYTYTMSFHMSVEKDLTGNFTILYTTATGSADPTPYEYNYGLTATQTDKGAYDISLPDMPLELGCTLDKKVLTCADKDTSSDLQLTFDKQ